MSYEHIYNTEGGLLSREQIEMLGQLTLIEIAKYEGFDAPVLDLLKCLQEAGDDKPSRNNVLNKVFGMADDFRFVDPSFPDQGSLFTKVIHWSIYTRWQQLANLDREWGSVNSPLIQDMLRNNPY